MATDLLTRVSASLARPGPTRVLSGVLVASGAFAPWWPPLLVASALAAFLLGLAARSPRTWVIASAAGLLGVAAAWFVRPAPLPVLLAVAAGSAVTMALADGLARLVRARARYREQGWQLAEAVRSRELSVLEAARTSERSRIAGEMHDSLGHDMALLAMQLSALQVEVRHHRLPDEVVSERLAALRGSAALATERLHQAIWLLEPAAPASGPAAVDRLAPTHATGWTAELDRSVERARASGLDVALRRPELMDDTSPLVARTVLRIAQEAMTNAAKHAPGQVLRLAVEADEETVRISAINPLRSAGPGGPFVDGGRAGSGRGLLALAERARLLGGSVRLEEDGREFRLDASVPRSADVAPGERPREFGPEDLRQRARDQVARRKVSLLIWPATAICVGVVAIGVAFVVANVASVLPRDGFAAVEVGRSQQEAEAVLPLLEMPDPPQTVPEPTADCRYYEERISFFERVTTFQICFDQGAVVSATEIPAGRSR